MFCYSSLQVQAALFTLAWIHHNFNKIEQELDSGMIILNKLEITTSQLVSLIKNDIVKLITMKVNETLSVV